MNVSCVFALVAVVAGVSQFAGVVAQKSTDVDLVTVSGPSGIDYELVDAKHVTQTGITWVLVSAVERSKPGTRTGVFVVRIASDNSITTSELRHPEMSSVNKQPEAWGRVVAAFGGGPSGPPSVFIRTGSTELSIHAAASPSRTNTVRFASSQVIDEVMGLADGRIVVGRAGADGKVVTVIQENGGGGVEFALPKALEAIDDVAATADSGVIVVGSRASQEAASQLTVTKVSSVGTPQSVEIKGTRGRVATLSDGSYVIVAQERSGVDAAIVLNRLDPWLRLQDRLVLGTIRTPRAIYSVAALASATPVVALALEHALVMRSWPPPGRKDWAVEWPTQSTTREWPTNGKVLTTDHGPIFVYSAFVSEGRTQVRTIRLRRPRMS